MNFVTSIAQKRIYARWAMPLMPQKTPLERPLQDFSRSFCDEAAPGIKSPAKTEFWRLIAFISATLTTIGLIAGFVNWFSDDGLRPFELVVTSLITLSFFWVAFSVSSAIVGIINLAKSPTAGTRQKTSALEVALVMPIYNEVASNAIGNAAAIISELADTDSRHSYTLFILSDTSDDNIARQEWQAVNFLRDKIDIHYRRRPFNHERKVGNIADWLEGWGGAYPAFLVLDADSLMSAEAITALTDELASDPSAGLVQSYPRIIGAKSFFGRIQQFSSAVYGGLLAEGLAKWAGCEGNFWGHNAIMRTAAFATCAGLPRLKASRNNQGLILSHDFVEAALLRRAGWAVRFLPRIKGSFEETPATVIDHVLRDRRWCYGNLQHLRLLTVRGFHPISRFHLFQGAMAYLLSVIWFLLLLFWAAIGKGQEASVITYFSDLNPSMPIWPEMSGSGSLWMLLFMYSMLLLPKFLGVIAVFITGVDLKTLGGFRQFLQSFVIEVIASIIYAPILMVQQVIAVARASLGFRQGWAPPKRTGGRYSFAMLAKFHALETLIGCLLFLGMGNGLISLWLLPIATSLTCAIGLSAISGIALNSKLLSTAEENAPPRILLSARKFQSMLEGITRGSETEVQSIKPVPKELPAKVSRV